MLALEPVPATIPQPILNQDVDAAVRRKYKKIEFKSGRCPTTNVDVAVRQLRWWLKEAQAKASDGHSDDDAKLSLRGTSKSGSH